MNWEIYAHPISDIRDWSTNKRLELKPDFQRNQVWSRAAQVMLIDTIIRNIPLPKIYIKSIIKDQNTYRIVVDGQQRLTAILMFVNNQLKLNHPYSGEYQGCKFNDLPQEIQDKILRYKIDINEIFNPSDDEIRDLYARVNKYTVQLNKQELRKADFPGDYIKTCEILSENEFFDDSKIFTTKQRRRMLDVEYVEELMAIVLEGIQDKKDSLDYLCEKYMNMQEEETYHNKKFTDVINDIKIIFETNILPIQATRFNQKSDFYSLFACIFENQKNGFVLDASQIDMLRRVIIDLSSNIAPHSENEKFRDYAMRCLSDANSINSRKWRTEFLQEYFSIAYKKAVIEE